MKPEQIQRFRAERFRIRWSLREVWVVTEWRDDCVYRTRSLGYAVLPDDYQLPREYLVTPISTKFMRQLEAK